MGEGQGQGRLVGGRYRLTAVVGRGGMGTVWRAHDELLDRDVAVKEVLLPPGLEANERDIIYQRTFREARASARLNHPGVVTVHDVVREDGRPWIIMEFVHARPLQDIIDSDGPLPPRRVAEIGMQLLEALTHAHAAGILHRDVKPSNVMIAEDGRAVLTDFGIAQMPGEVTLTQTGLVMGSPAYIAPERAQGDKAIPESDLWSLGATLYTAVEGRSPYERGDAMAALAATLTEDPAPPRRAGRLGPIIEGLLVRDPARRMPAAAALPLLAEVAAADPPRYPRPPRPAPAPAPAPGPVLGPIPFDPGSADTVNDPPSLENAALAADAPGTFGRHSPGRYAAQAETLDSADDGTRSKAAPAIGRPRRRRLVLGGVAAGLTIAVVAVGAVLLLPHLTSGNGSTGKTSRSPAPAPPGYTSVRGPGGFTLAVPAGWTRSQNRNSTFWNAPDRNTFIQVDTTAWPGSSNQQAYRAEADTKSRTDLFAGYAQKRIEDLTYQGQPATDWEFTFTATNKTKIHALDRFVRFGNATYAIYFRAPESAWRSSAGHITVLYRTFRPAQG
ncbi:MAG TPA: protein kinase [Streptosporangiaceae bacterium]